jgi:DNA-binding HxlR family transcriptional regulator
MSEALNPSLFLDAPLGLLAQFLEEHQPKGAVDLRRVTALLIDRLVFLLRAAPRSQIVEESADLSRMFGSGYFEGVKDEQPAAAGAWEALADVLSEAGRRTDHAAIDSILASSNGLPRTIIDELAQRSGRIRRAELRGVLNVTESYLSHILREMERAGLIVRIRSDEKKEVTIELGPIGREVVDQQLLPRWIEYLVELLKQNGQGIDPMAIEEELAARGAPSRIAGQKLAEALSGTISLVAARNAQVMQRTEEERSHRLAAQRLRLSDTKQRPLALFVPDLATGTR